MLLALFSSAVHLLASYQSGSISQKQQSISLFIRYFTPQSEQFEDAVTGSAHCSLAPLWAQRIDGEGQTGSQADLHERGEADV